MLNGSGLIINFRLKEKIMFMDSTIDFVQTTKKSFVNTVFANQKGIADALNSFVDAQTAYTKSAAKAGSDVAAKLSSEAVKLAEDVSHHDYSKSFEQFTKAFTAKK
jgi:hypothetical protein